MAVTGRPRCDVHLEGSDRCRTVHARLFTTDSTHSPCEYIICAHRLETYNYSAGVIPKLLPHTDRVSAADPGDISSSKYTCNLATCLRMISALNKPSSSKHVKRADVNYATIGVLTWCAVNPSKSATQDATFLKVSQAMIADIDGKSFNSTQRETS
eukprot:GHVU01175573.1.p1 GENE.GHVU01175573.1~~GHVU01175573.1.p1  ORF type:complete len:156 (-),score=8.72 GHVU01175573.1:658-1125(-)